MTQSRGMRITWTRADDLIGTHDTVTVWYALCKRICQWPWCTRERHNCTCLSGKHWQFIVMIVDGYIPVIIGSEALIREQNIVILYTIAIYVWRYIVDDKKIDIAQAYLVDIATSSLHLNLSRVGSLLRFCTNAASNDCRLTNKS